MLNDYKIALLLGRIAHELQPYAAPEDPSRREDSQPDFIEVGRTAYELGNRHGQNACQYAAGLAVEAISEGKTEEAAFWKAVAEFLRPRGSRLAGFGIARVEPQGFPSRPEGQREEPNYVRRWRRILLQYAEMFENDRSDLTKQRREEIHSVLFSGMGSFSDFNLDSRVFGGEVGEANKRLQVLRTELYSVFAVSMTGEE